MRILLVNYEYPPLGGGGGIAMMEIAEELARTHEVHVLTSGTKALPAVEKHDSLNLTIHRAQVFGRSARATASFASMAAFLPAGTRLGNRLVSELSFDVVNTWFAIPSGIVGSAVAKKNGIPHVLTFIGGDIYDPSKWYSPHQFYPAGLAVRRVLRQADSHVAISTDIVGRAKEHFGFNRPVEVIPLGIHEPQFVPKTREELGLDASKKYVVAVGRLVRRKDYPTLLKAAGLTVPRAAVGLDLLDAKKRSASFSALHERKNEAAFMWRTPQHKLILCMTRRADASTYTASDITGGEFYDLLTDPQEWNNLYDNVQAQPDVRKKMTDALLKHLGKLAPIRA